MLKYVFILSQFSDIVRLTELSASKSAAISEFLKFGISIRRPLIRVVSDYCGCMKEMECQG